MFVVLATLNSAGYRYGASDQAFYIPAVVHQLHPDFYPRDASLIESQARLTLVEESIAAVARLTGASLPSLFAGLYAGTLVLLALAALSLARIYYRTPLATIAVLAGLTLRHAISRTGTNTLEGYFHPRQLAFALGAWAVACFLRARRGPAVVLVLVAGLVHPTTALWFGVWLAVATVAAERRLLVPAIAGGGAAVAAGLWMLTAGPLAGRLRPMDAEWRATLVTKDYLFPLDWPWSVWLINLSYPLLIVWLYGRRRTAGLLVPRETAVATGALSLLVVFGALLPFNAAGAQMAIQLQPARIFWMLDFLATFYVVWALVESGRTPARRAVAVAALVCLLTVSRGLYVAIVAFPSRPMFALDLPDTDWTRAMAWARQSPSSSHWLADPQHAWLYGTSLRVAGQRDVFVEASKDQAIGMYHRAVAMRTRDRIAEVGDFPAMTAERARALSLRYDLDFLVTEATLPLPVAFASGTLNVYRLR